MVRELIETCRDGQEGFRTAAEGVADDSELKMLLSSFSLQRAKFAGELEAQLVEMGEHHPEREGPSLSGAAHRGWINLKASLTRADNHALLAECERGEDAAMAEYNKALKHELPGPVAEIVRRQRQEVIATHNTIRALRDATPAKTVRARGERAAATATEVWGEMKSRAGEFRKSTEGYIRRNPLPSLACAVLAGFSVGMIFYALEVRNERARLEARSRPLRKVGASVASLLESAKSGYQSSVDKIRDRVEEIAPRHRGNRFTRSARSAWSRFID